MRLSAPQILASLLSVLAFLPGAPSSAQTSPAPATKMLFLIRGPDGVITPIRAVSSQQQGPVLILVNASGGRAVVQARTVMAQLPWLTVEEVEAGAMDPGQLAAKYELAARRFPSLQKVLTAEAALFKAIVNRRTTEAAAAKSAAEARIQAATATVYDPSAGYTAESLEGLLAAAEAVRGDDPATAGRIDQWAAPFRDHLEKLKAGSLYENGSWVTREELVERARAEREAAFRQSLESLRIDGDALPAETVRGLVTKAVIATALVMLLGLILIFLGRRRFSWRVVGVALFAGSPALLAILFFLATRNPGELPPATGTADVQPIITALEQASGAQPDTPLTDHAISELALNTFLARYVRLEGPAQPGGWAATREALAVRLQPKRLFFFELLRSMNREWIVRYDLVFRPGENGHPRVVLAAVKLGALELPPGLAQPLWDGLRPPLSAILTTLRVTEQFIVLPPAEASIALTPPRPAEPAPTPEPAPSATPAPVENPAAATPEPAPAAEANPFGPVEAATPTSKPSPEPPAPPAEAPAVAPEQTPAEQTPTPEPSVNPFDPPAAPPEPADANLPIQSPAPVRNERSTVP